jgi:hypothetical protein
MRRLALAALLIVTMTKTSEVFSSESAGKDLRGLVAGPVADAPLPPALARTVDPVINALWSRFSLDSALGHVKFVSQFWRLSGNPGYNATLDRVKSRMLDSGFADGTSPANRQAASVWVEEYPNTGKGWSYSIGTLALSREGGTDEPVLTREDQNLSLCINSFSTPAGGVMARLVDVGRGREADFAGKDVGRRCARRCGSRIAVPDCGDARRDRRRVHHPGPLHHSGSSRRACDAARPVEHLAVGQHPVRRG